MGKGGPQPAHQGRPGDLQLEAASVDLEDPEANIHGHLMPPVSHLMSSDKAIKEEDDCSAADRTDLSYDEVRDIDEGADRPSSCRHHNVNNNAKKTSRLRKRAKIYVTRRSVIDVFSSNLLETKGTGCHIGRDCANMESLADDEVVLGEIKDRTQNNKYLRSSTEDDDSNKDNSTRSNKSNNREINMVDTNAQPDKGYNGETSARHFKDKFKAQTRDKWRDRSSDGTWKDNTDSEIRIEYQGSPKNAGSVSRGASWRITKRNSFDNTGKVELSHIKCPQPPPFHAPTPSNKDAVFRHHKRSPSCPSTADTDRTTAANLSSPLATGMSWRSNGDPPGTHNLLEQEETLRSITPITMDLELPCLLQEAESPRQVSEMDKTADFHTPDCTQNLLKQEVKDTVNENNAQFIKNEILTLPDFGTRLLSLVKQGTFSEFSFTDKRKKNAANESTRGIKESDSSFKLTDGMLNKKNSLEPKLNQNYLSCASLLAAAPTNCGSPPKLKQGSISPHAENKTKEVYRTKEEQNLDNIFDCALEYSERSYCSVPIKVSNELYKEIEFPILKSYIDSKGTHDNKVEKVEENISFIPRGLIETFKRATSFNALLQENNKVTDERQNKIKLREEFKCAERHEKLHRVVKENRRKGIEKKQRKCLDNSSRSKDKSAASCAPLSQKSDLRNLILASAIFSSDVSNEGAEQDSETFIFKDVFVGTADSINPKNKAVAFEEAFLRYKQSSFNNFVPGCGNECSEDLDKSESSSENSKLSPKNKPVMKKSLLLPCAKNSKLSMNNETVVNKSPVLPCAKNSKLSMKDETVGSRYPFLSCSKNSQLSNKDEATGDKSPRLPSAKNSKLSMKDECAVNKSPLLPSAKNSKLSLKDEAAVKRYPFLSCSKNSKQCNKDKATLDKSPVLPSAKNSKLSLNNETVVNKSPVLLSAKNSKLSIKDKTVVNKSPVLLSAKNSKLSIKDKTFVNRSPVLPSATNSKLSMKDEAAMNRYPFLSCSKNSHLYNKNETTLDKLRILPSAGTSSNKQTQIKDTKRHVSFENLKVSATNRPGRNSFSSSATDSILTDSPSIRTNRLQPDKPDPQRSPKIGEQFKQPSGIINDSLYSSNTGHRCNHYAKPVHKENPSPTRLQSEELFPYKHEDSKATPIVKGHDWDNMTQKIAKTQHPDGLSKTRDFHKLTIDHFKKSTSWLPNKGSVNHFTKTVTFAAPIFTTDEYKPRQPQENSLWKNMSFSKEPNRPAEKTATFLGELEQNKVVGNFKSNLDSNRKTSPVGNHAGKTQELKITSHLPALFQAKKSHSLSVQLVSAHESRVMTSSASLPTEKNYALSGELIKAHEKRVIASRTSSPAEKQDSPPRQLISKHKTRSHSKNSSPTSPALSKPEKDPYLSKQITSNHENYVFHSPVQIREENPYILSEQSKPKDKDTSRMRVASLHSQSEQLRYLPEHQLLSQDELTTSTSREFSSTDSSPIPPINQNRNGKMKGSARNTPRKLNKKADLTKDSYKVASYRVLSRYNIVDTANTLAEGTNILLLGNVRHSAPPVLYLPDNVLSNTRLDHRVSPPIRGFQSPTNKPLGQENNLSNVLKESQNMGRSEHRPNKQKMGHVPNANTTNSNEFAIPSGNASQAQPAKLIDHLRVLNSLNVEVIKTHSEKNLSKKHSLPLPAKPLSNETTNETNVSPVSIIIHNVDSENKIIPASPLHASDFVNQKMGKQNSFISCLSARLFQSLSPSRLSAYDEITRQRKYISSPVDGNTDLNKTVSEEEISSPVDSPIIKKHAKDLIFDYSKTPTSEQSKADKPTQDNELFSPASLSSTDQSTRLSVKSRESSDISIYSKHTKDLLIKRYPFLADLGSHKKLQPGKILRSKSAVSSSSSSKKSKDIAKPQNCAKCDTKKHTCPTTCDMIVGRESHRSKAHNNSSTVSGKKKLLTEYNESRRSESSWTSSSSRSVTDDIRASSTSEQEIVCVIKTAPSTISTTVSDKKKQSCATKEQLNVNEFSVKLDPSKGIDLQKQIEYFQSFKNWPNSGRTNQTSKSERPFSFSPNFYSQAKNAKMLPGLAMMKEQQIEVLRRLGTLTGVKKSVVEGREVAPIFKEAERVTTCTRDGQQENLIKVFTEGHYNPVNNIVSIVVKPVNMVLSSAGLNVVVKVYRNLFEEKEEVANVSVVKKSKLPRDIIDIRASNPPFNTTITKDADERHRRTFGHMKII